MKPLLIQSMLELLTLRKKAIPLILKILTYDNLKTLPYFKLKPEFIHHVGLQFVLSQSECLHLKSLFIGTQLLIRRIIRK